MKSLRPCYSALLVRPREMIMIRGVLPQHIATGV
jgi:hypothetical protein